MTPTTDLGRPVAAALQADPQGSVVVVVVVVVVDMLLLPDLGRPTALVAVVVVDMLLLASRSGEAGGTGSGGAHGTTSQHQETSGAGWHTQPPNAPSR